MSKTVNATADCEGCLSAVNSDPATMVSYEIVDVWRPEEPRSNTETLSAVSVHAFERLPFPEPQSSAHH